MPNPRWRVRARYAAYDAPRSTEVGAAVDGLTHVYDAPGELVFTLQGEEFRLVAFPGHGDGDLLVLFTDATSGLTTYAANRSLSVPAPDEDGWTVLDFNRAVNLPCAYTDFATCPLPPAGNHLPLGHRGGREEAAGTGAGGCWAGGARVKFQLGGLLSGAVARSSPAGSSRAWERDS